MRQALSMLMLATADLARSRRFYEGGLGWQAWGQRQSKTSVKYMAGGVVIAVIDRAYVCGESGLLPGSGSFGIVPVLNLTDRDAVDAAFKEVRAAGGRITSPPQLREGGLYTFYFQDPDSNPWEIVWNPNMTMTADGTSQPV